MGIFVVFEGFDASGKSFIIEKVIEYLKKHKINIHKTHEPGGTKAGQEIREILLNSKNYLTEKTKLNLFLASRTQNLEEIILPNLKSKDVVLCDRYFYSTFAYQGFYGKLNLDLIFNLHKDLNIFETLPDLVFYLNVDTEILHKRFLKKNIQETQDNFHKKESEEYVLKMQKNYQDTFDYLRKKQTLNLIQINNNHHDFNLVIEKIGNIILKKWKNKNFI